MEMTAMKWDKPMAYEYMKAANPDIPHVPIKLFESSAHREGPSRVVYFDNSRELKTNYPASSPNCLASYVHVQAGESLTTDIEATSHLFYVLRGEGETQLDGESVRWKTDDIITLPYCARVTHKARSDSAMYWVNDNPLLRYLGVRPARAIFPPIHYDSQWLRQQTEMAAHEPDAKEQNRIGILLVNPACPLTLTVTPTLWSLLEVVPPGAVLPPHRHNSVALDLAIKGCKRGFTLMGAEVDGDGAINNPVRVDWDDASAFTTPPMLWHEHHNEGDENAWVFPVQDAGLITYERILDIRFGSLPHRETGGRFQKAGVSAF
jgi:gentisate 1,2-dioxygenase